MFLKALYSYERHFLYSKKLVAFTLGVLPDISLFKRLLIFLSLFIFILPVMFQMCYQFFMTNIKLVLLIKLLQRILFSLLFGCLFWYIFLNFKTMTLVFEHIKEDYELVTDDDELNIIEKYTKQSKYYSLVMIVTSNLYIMITSLPSILNIIAYQLGIFDEICLTLPLSINTVSDVGLLHYCLFCYQIIILIIVLSITILILSSFLVSVQHASSQFSIIILKIRRPFMQDDFNIFQKSDDEFNWITDIIKRYKRVTELIELLNAVSKLILLVSIFISMLEIIVNFVCLLQLSVDLKHIGDNIEMISYTVICIFEVYIVFYVGQKLLDHSNNVFEELRQVPFYMLSVKTQKLLLFLITRTMKPSSLSIGGIYLSSHEVFAALLQKAFSFATVFYSIRS